MFWYPLFVCFVCSVSGFKLDALNPKCSADDFVCVGEVTRNLYKLITPGIKELGIEPIDPMHHEIIESELSTLKFTLTDTVITGFKDFHLNFLTIVKAKSMHFDFTLPFYEMHGKYKTSGKLLNLPMEGEGTFYFNATNLHTTVDVNKEFYEKDGEFYLNLTNLRATNEQLGDTYIHIENLFDGNKTLAEPVEKFINEYPKAAAHVYESVLTTTNMNSIFARFNKILEVTPITDIVYDEV